MLYTLTGNLLWEKTFVFAKWTPGGTQRAASESFQVGGKGINVSKMLNRLGAPNTALCFTGGAAGCECAEWLCGHKFVFSAFHSERSTRAGLVVRGGRRRETTFLGPDAPPDPGAVLECAKFLENEPDGGVLVVCGSIPGWESPDFEPLRAAVDGWLVRGEIVADSYGPPMAWFASRPIRLGKINRDEFEELFPSGAGDLPARLVHAQASGPVRSWVVTDGPGPVHLIDKNGQTATLQPPPVKEVSATGSGDVLLACILEAHLNRGLPLREAVAFALPYAAANAAHPRIAEFPEPLNGRGSF